MVYFYTCGHEIELNLCNPLTSLNSEIDNAIATAGKANGGNTFTSENIYIAGHSLGGVGARHYVDVKKSSFAGLAPGISPIDFIFFCILSFCDFLTM